MTVINKATQSTTQKIKEYIGNHSLTLKIKSLFEAEPSINLTEVNVVTESGIVKLSGKVPSKKILNKIKEIAAEVNGVKKIITNLKIAQ